MHAQKIIKGVIVIGCGPHYRGHYHTVLEKQPNLRIHLVIDLVDQKEQITDFFHNRKIKAEKALFLPEEYRNSITIEEIDRLVRGQINLEKIQAVLICAEPKVRKPYALWAIQNGLDVFVDKPLTAFCSYENMDTLFSDYLEISEKAEEKKINFVISCQRRAHFGYQYLRRYLQDLIYETGVPLTFIDIHFGGGKFSMPDEYFSRENHPHKYGYGVLLHSGYHYIDLFMNLAQLNNSIIPLFSQEMEFSVLATNPYQFSHIFNNDFYHRMFNTNRFEKFFTPENISKLRSMGETDVMIMGRLKREEDVMTNFSIKLTDRSVSHRSWHELPQKGYTFNGRMRQERVIVHLGNLCTVHLLSHSFPKVAETKGVIEDFSIQIINNSELIKRSSSIYITREKLSELFPDLLITDEMNVKAKKWQLYQFLRGEMDVRLLPLTDIRSNFWI